MRLVLLRHAVTAGNEQRRYVGRRTDEPISVAGGIQCQEAGVRADVRKVYVSPLLRARQTAELCFPRALIVPVKGLEEFDFGAFEGRCADRMADDAAYRSWVDGECVGRCPGGESLESFMERSNRALVSLLVDAARRGEEEVVVVAHGGTIMAAFHGLARESRAYYEWRADNCEGYAATCELTGDSVALVDVRRACVCDVRG